MRIISTNSRAHRWYWIGGSVGLGLVVVVCVLLYPNNQTTPGSEVLKVKEPRSGVPSALPTVAMVNTPSQLSKLDFPLGSIEEACGLNEYPAWKDYFWNNDESHSWVNDPYDAEGDFIALASKECMDALEAHIDTVNPYQYAHQFAFVKLDNPLTFARIFADPEGDLGRVRDALSRPECLLKHTETNWELNEACHADALLNYALINTICFNGFWPPRNRTYYRSSENLTAEQDRFMWKQELEDEWIRMKCKDLDSTLALTSHQPHPQLYDLLKSLQDPHSKLGRREEGEFLVGEPESLLIGLAARLGDDTAGLTQPLYFTGQPYGEEGYKHGRFSRLLTSTEWYKFATKKEPSAERFLQTFTMIALASNRRPDPRDKIEFDWEKVAHHLCEPPYNDEMYYEDEEKLEPKSCKEIVHEIRQRNIQFRPLLDALDKFEQVALKLDVYE